MTDTTLHAEPYNANRPTLTAIISGTIVALGLMVLFTLLGLAIGVASLEAIGEGLGFGAAIYLIITQIISLAAGGYTAARFMFPADTNAAMLAGAAVWALTTLIVAFGGLSAGTSAISSSTALVAQTAKTTGTAVQAIIPDDIALPDLSEIADTISMENLPPELQQVLENAGVTPSRLRSEAREAFREVISEQEMKRARSLLTSTLSDIAAKPASFEEEVNRLLDQLIEGENAVINKEDIDEARNALQTRLGINDTQTQAIIDEVKNAFDSAVETLRQTISDLQERLTDTVDDIQSAVSSAAWWLFIASLLGLGAAAAAGRAGRPD
ncbi:apolipoprotein A1/A4/E family protein [Marinobacter salicampi]|uniref:apolipoprotein A1/A4/E family protein n=1 Tax=Marinobacter salicampi TaxID=435907 RepID=UPI001408A049|nr:apolipoprotein A1/A4/E family protein [Marinobacter salicampi]